MKNKEILNPFLRQIDKFLIYFTIMRCCPTQNFLCRRTILPQNLEFLRYKNYNLFFFIFRDNL